jgi:hypothetical protein
MPVNGNPDLIVYFNDFLVAGDYSASDWTLTETDAGATQAVKADHLGGALALTNTNTEDHIVQIQSAEEWIKLSAGKRVWFETRVKMDNVGQNDGFLGFATTDTTILAGTTDSVGFRWVDESAAVTAVTEDNTSETTTSSVHTWVAAAYATLGFYWDGVSAVRFYVNRALVATHTANIEQTNQLALTVTMQAGAAAVDVMDIDYLYVAMER